MEAGTSAGAFNRALFCLVRRCSRLLIVCLGIIDTSIASHACIPFDVQLYFVTELNCIVTTVIIEKQISFDLLEQLYVKTGLSSRQFPAFNLK